MSRSSAWRRMLRKLRERRSPVRSLAAKTWTTRSPTVATKSEGVSLGGLSAAQTPAAPNMAAPRTAAAIGERRGRPGSRDVEKRDPRKLSGMISAPNRRIPRHRLRPCGYFSHFFGPQCPNQTVDQSPEPRNRTGSMRSVPPRHGLRRSARAESGRPANVLKSNRLFFAPFWRRNSNLLKTKRRFFAFSRAEPANSCPRGTRPGPLPWPRPAGSRPRRPSAPRPS